MSQRQIREKLIQILLNKFPFCAEAINGSNIDTLFDTPLVGDVFKFSATELYRFLIVIEDEFSFYANAEDIWENGFATLDDVVRLIVAKAKS